MRCRGGKGIGGRNSARERGRGGGSSPFYEKKGKIVICECWHTHKQNADLRTHENTHTYTHTHTSKHTYTQIHSGFNILKISPLDFLDLSKSRSVLKAFWYHAALRKYKHRIFVDYIWSCCYFDLIINIFLSRYIRRRNFKLLVFAS